MTAAASAPASSANLGPGFDCLALALELRCSVRAGRSEAWGVAHRGPEHPPPGADDLVLSVARAAAGESGPLELEVENHVPVERGLGSSAAVRAAVYSAVRRALGDDPARRSVLERVAQDERHPDNAAAAVYGGLVAVSVEGAVIRLELDSSWRPVVAVPDRALSTERARAVLPESVPREAAVRNLARLAFLVEGLRTGSVEILRGASGDELHEPYRRELFPRAARLVEAAREAGAALAAWSGAGSSVLALTTADRRQAVGEALEAELAGRGRVLTPEVAQEGLR